MTLVRSVWEVLCFETNRTSFWECSSLISFDTTGAITSDLAAPQTKNQLGDAYGMSEVSKVGEWYQQAANFAAYVTGKTASDVALIHVDEATKPTDADLATSVTIAIGGFQDLIAKAVQ